MGESDGRFVFSNEEPGYGVGGFMPQHFLNSNQYNFQSGNQDICGNSEFHGCTESLSKRIRLSPEFNHQEGDVDFPPLGLKLTMTPSFVSLLEMRLSKGLEAKQQDDEGSSHEKRRTKMDALESQAILEKEKLKASNFPAIFIKIGAWQRMPMNEGDLIAKLYYAKRKLVWEVLEGPLKSKIEIQWSDIIAIRAFTPDNEPGILDIELNQPPLFYRETNPQPRKHTIWQQASDFTGGQAPIWRRHHVTFPPGILDKNYEQLLQCDERLYALSKKPFPSHESPYFDPTLFGTTLNFSGYGPNKAAAHYPYRAYSTTVPRVLPSFRVTTPNPSLSSVMDLPFTYDEGRNYQFATQRQTCLNQNTNIPRDNCGIPFGITSITRPNNVYAPSCYAHDESGLLDDIATDLLVDAQVNEGTLLEKVDSMCSLLEPVGVNNNNINESSYHSELDYHVMRGDQVNNNYGLNGTISEPIDWLATQGSSEGTFELPDNNPMNVGVGGFFNLNPY